ncbi:hypothetical protein ACOMHN_001438 [Nucella lapillus]
MNLLASLRALQREFVCDLVIFLYKVGEALLDATVRPYIVSAVCRDLYDTRPAPLASWVSWDSHPRVDLLPQPLGVEYGAHVPVHNVSVCYRLDELPECHMHLL